MHALQTSSNLKYGKCCSRRDEDFVCRFLYSCHLPVFASKHNTSRFSHNQTDTFVCCRLLDGRVRVC